MNPIVKRQIRTRMPVFTARLLWILSRLVRTRIIGFERVQEFGQVGFAHWHGDELALIPRFGGIEAAILVSHSNDGEIMARGARSLGYHVVRGSSSRGAVAGLLALIKAAREGHHVVLAVDGPRGPRGVCKPGIVRLAQKTHVPLLPVGVAVSCKFVFDKSWNKVYLPLPFGKQVVVFDTPLFFAVDKDDAAMERHCREVETALHRAQAKAKKVLVQW